MIVYSSTASILLNSSQTSLPTSANLAFVKTVLLSAPLLGGVADTASALELAQQVYLETNISLTGIVVISPGDEQPSAELYYAARVLVHESLSLISISINGSAVSNLLGQLYTTVLTVPSYAALQSQPFYDTSSEDILCIVPPTVNRIMIFWARLC